MNVFKYYLNKFNQIKNKVVWKCNQGKIKESIIGLIFLLEDGKELLNLLSVMDFYQFLFIAQNHKKYIVTAFALDVILVKKTIKIRQGILILL